MYQDPFEHQPFNVQMPGSNSHLLCTFFALPEIVGPMTNDHEIRLVVTKPYKCWL